MKRACLYKNTTELVTSTLPAETAVQAGKLNKHENKHVRVIPQRRDGLSYRNIRIYLRMKRNIQIAAILLIAVFSSISITIMAQDSDVVVKQASSIIIEDGGTGPYKAIATGDESLPGFTIYRPENLMVFNKKQRLPVVLWGNGGCANSSAGFKNFLSEIAANGYVVIAIGPFESLGTPDQEMMRQPTKSAQLLEALDWITAQNKRKSGIFKKKINITRVAVMGQSCGGLQAIEVSTDPRITPTVICNSGVLNNAPPAGIKGPFVSKG